MRHILVSMMIGAVLAAAPATADAGSRNCRNTGSFDRWMADFKRDAAAAGVSQRAIDKGLRGVGFSAKVVKHDRRQVVFSQTFSKFAGRMVNNYRLKTGRKLMKKYAGTFDRIEQQYGVPAPVITGFWGLETDFGANTGDFPVLTALATLAYDCRRPELFRPQLIDALRIVERGDLQPNQMLGAWAGELGQTQFLPSDYYHRGVDYDGDGKVNLIKSVPDVLASTANLLVHHGWRRGQPWMTEVRVPTNLPWDQADVTIKHPRSQWAAWGVTRANGKQLPSDGLAASLQLPMGRNGPAFLVYPNFDIYRQWNKSNIYSTTAAYFATRLAGASKVHPGNGRVASLSYDQIKQLQRKLKARGYDVGGVDGFIGLKTRAAVKDMQLKLGLPADSFPTPDLLNRL
ncbi:lytic murein transglycosylase [Rhodobium orientis]|uniref:Lytic transglycosylase n=1 Tax=Rhodobium orientis TaxID=34017 RepID=A0A327JNZ8_9HYPH|nr:lytic murein transglycosylase [Rhodobium orientis]MBB4304936.1 lytic murein transglycosylase [Rhodobium orientis]MBK5951255.1 lytic transglycosylase [Rhodobium orientis]RAI27093.1 lytic transglycosylase [Rhodobium orientis]